MWTPTTRAQHTRDHPRHAGDLTDAEWAVLEPLLPARRPMGRPPTPLRRALEAIFHVPRGGVAWRMLPKEFPPYQTVSGWFAAWRDDGTWEALNRHLVPLDRERAGREASPTGAALGSRGVRATEAGGPRGCDAAEKVKGRKRHAASDPEGRLLAVLLTPACVQGRDGVAPPLKPSRRSAPLVELAWADWGWGPPGLVGTDDAFA